MAELTKEWLLKTITELEEERAATPGAVNEDAAMALAAMKLALASLAEPVGFIARHKETGKFGSYLHPKADWFKNDDYEVLSAYTAPPAPVSVPDAMTPKQASRAECGEVRGCLDGWNSCRAAMLPGADEVTTATSCLMILFACVLVELNIFEKKERSNHLSFWSELLPRFRGKA
ncbi:MAG: hypothetical protein ACLR9W_07130 [Enterobacter hormaechei]